MMITGEPRPVCGYGKRCTTALRGSGTCILYVERDPANMQVMAIESVTSETDVIVLPFGQLLHHHFGPLVSVSSAARVFIAEFDP